MPAERIDIGRAIKILRVVKMEWTLKELSAKSGISTPMVSELENGKRNPSLSTLEKLAQAFEIRLSQMITLAETPNEAIRGLAK